MTWRGAGIGGLLGLTCVLSLACGGTESNSGQPSAGAGGGGSAAAGASATAGGGNAAAAAGTSATAGASSSGAPSGGTSSGGAATSGATGTIQIGQLLSTTGRGPQITAWFRAKDAVDTTDCVKETFGDCSVSTCTPNGKTATPRPNAGTITITDGAMIDVTLTAAAGESYTRQTTTSPVFSGKELLTVTAAGGEVPAFTTEVAVPLVITVSAPALDETGMGSVPASGDLTLTFDNRAADGETETQLHASTMGIEEKSLYCRLPTSSGTATIPAAALDKVRGLGGELLLIVARSKQLTAGEFSVNVITFMSAMNPAKSQAAVLKL